MIEQVEMKSLKTNMLLKKIKVKIEQVEIKNIKINMLLNKNNLKNMTAKAS